MYVTLFFLVFSVIFTVVLSIYSRVPDLVSKDGFPGNPGIKLRISQSGFDYINAICTDILNEMLQNNKFSDIDHKDDKGTVKITNIRTKSYKPPTSTRLYLVPPDSIGWQLRDMDLFARADDMTVNYDAAGTLFNGTGPVEMDLGANLDVIAKLTSTFDGKPQTTVTKCGVTFETIDTRYYANEKSAADFFQLIKPFVIAYAIPKLKERVCRNIEIYMDAIVNRKFTEMTTKFPLRRDPTECRNDPFARGCEDQDVQAKRTLDSLPLNKLIFNPQLVHEPIVTNDYLELWHKGEISWLGQETPFYPKLLRVDQRPDKMFQIFVSDYVFNSLFYHLHKNHPTMVDITAQTHPELASYLQLNCPFGECIGKLFPELLTQYFDHEMDLRYITSQMPYMIFDQNGGKLHMDNYIGIYPKDRFGVHKFALLTEMDSTAEINDVNIDPVTGYISGKFALQKFTNIVKKTQIGNISTDRTRQLGAMADRIIQKSADSYVKEGVPVPKFNTIHFRDTDVKFNQGTLRISSNMKADVEMFRRESEEAARLMKQTHTTFG